MRRNDRQFLTLLVVVVFLVALGANAGSAKDRKQAKPKCPVTKVTCTDSAVMNDTLKFIAEVQGGDQNVTPTYNWTVSAGSIASGQGTSNIEVSTDGLADDSSVTATVDVGGFDRECGYGSTAASCTTSVVKKPEARKLDEYGKLMPKDENTRLDNFVIELNTDPTAQGYIIAYNGKTSRAGDAKKSAESAKTYLVSKRALEPNRVVAVDGGIREQPAVELWIVPEGAPPPQATPTVKPGDAKAGSPAKPKTTRRPKM